MRIACVDEREEAAGLEQHDGGEGDGLPPWQAEAGGSSTLCSVSGCNVSPLRGRFCKEHTPRFETSPQALPSEDLRIIRRDTRVDVGEPLDPVVLGWRLRELRKKRGLTQEEVRQTTGIREATLRRIEQGHGSSVKTLLCLMNVYRPNLMELFRRVR